MSISSHIDHTLLKATARLADVEKLCREAAEYGFASVCVPPPYVKRCKLMLASSGIKVTTVIGFPMGYSLIEAKRAEASLALGDGADELDMVINLIALKNEDEDYLKKEISAIVQITGQKNKVLKAIIETGILSDDEIIRCCRLYAAAGVHFVKTSTGFAEKGATVKAVQLMRRYLPSEVKIKASGGIRTYAFAKELLEAGAERLGCSNSVTIIEEEKNSINKIL